eukprot:gene27360-biopygen10168
MNSCHEKGVRAESSWNRSASRGIGSFDSSSHVPSLGVSWLVLGIIARTRRVFATGMLFRNRYAMMGDDMGVHLIWRTSYLWTDMNTDGYG